MLLRLGLESELCSFWPAVGLVCGRFLTPLLQNRPWHAPAASEACWFSGLIFLQVIWAYYLGLLLALLVCCLFFPPFFALLLQESEDKVVMWILKLDNDLGWIIGKLLPSVLLSCYQSWTRVELCGKGNNVLGVSLQYFICIAFTAMGFESLHDVGFESLHGFLTASCEWNKQDHTIFLTDGKDFNANSVDLANLNLALDLSTRKLVDALSFKSKLI